MIALPWLEIESDPLLDADQCPLPCKELIGHIQQFDVCDMKKSNGASLFFTVWMYPFILCDKCRHCSIVNMDIPHSTDKDLDVFLEQSTDDVTNDIDLKSC
jgi:hypothetical protein